MLAAEETFDGVFHQAADGHGPHTSRDRGYHRCLGLYCRKIHISAKLACLRIAVDSHIYHDRPLGHHIGCHEPRLPYRNHQDFSLTGKLG